LRRLRRGVPWYAQALSAAGRNDEATAKFDEAMAIEPDHLTVLTRLCEFLASSRRLPAARAVADWLSRLHPGAAPIEAFRAELGRPRLADAPERLRHWRAQLSAFRGGRSAPPRPTPSPPRERLHSPPGSSAPRVPSSPPTVQSWLRHAVTIGAAPRSPVDVVLLGDSLAHQWPANAWTGRRVFNLGVSGDRAQQVLWRLACFDDGAIDAKAVVLIVGVNNLASGDDVQSTIEAIGDVIVEIRRAAPGAKIAVVSLPPFGPEFRLRDDDRQALNASLAKMPDVIVVGEPARWAPRGTEAGCYQPDAIHFTRTGYERLTAATARALAVSQP
jgi:platelet-activating factor acetylhydrolase IB subunit beta/gamma